MIAKTELLSLELDQLENRKSKMLSQFNKGQGDRILRNSLYELLGVMDFKKKYFSAEEISAI